MIWSILCMLSLVTMCRFPGGTRTLPEPEYDVASIDANGGSGEARAVNAAGDVAGQLDGNAFVWHAGALRKYPGIRNSGMGDGSYMSLASGIDGAGIAVGSNGAYFPCSMSGLEFAQATTFLDGITHFIDPNRAGACSFEADAINDRGTIVGENSYRGFVRYRDGREIEVAPLSTRPEFNGTRATALDNEGHIVGVTTIDVTHVPQIQVGEESIGVSGPIQPMYGPDTNAYVVHAFLLTITAGRQRMRDLGALDRYPDTYATAINEDLTVVGYSGTFSQPKQSRIHGPSHAWVWQHGRMTDIGGDRSTDSFAYGVNDASVIVGCAGNDAVRWVDKRMQDLNTLIDRHSGWHLACARAINRNGEIVGYGEYRGGRRAPFRLLPRRGDYGFK